MSTTMTPKEAAQRELLALLEYQENELTYNRINTMFPDEGPYRRELYPKHVAFMAAGKEFSQRAFIAANRTGKTMTGGVEMTYHLTGLYPHWWEGRKFLSPIRAWAVGKTNQDTKEILQETLLGSTHDIGSGLIPRDLIAGSPTKKPGVADAIETVRVKHVSGGISELTFKTYEQGRESFQGTKKQVIWLDEEPKDPGIYSECLTRTMDDVEPGIIFCTFTPLFGLSEVVLTFLPHGKFPKDNINGYKYVTQVSWEEVPHLSEKQKEEILASYSRFERDARSKGIPSLGAGAIYPYLECDFVVKPFPIPEWWPRGYALDVGWNKTAAVWGAMDPDTRIVYLYSEHYAGESHPAIHASAIKQRGDWMYGAIDPASCGVNQADGRALFDLYEQEGLLLEKADNSVEAGVLRVGQMFESGMLKIFSSLENLLSELRTYRRDEKGKIVKKNDHAVDAMRYLCMTGIEFFVAPPNKDNRFRGNDDDTFTTDRDTYTGY